MHIRMISYLFLLFLTALPATVSAQSVLVLGLNSMEGDDDSARELTRALRTSIAAQGCSVSDRDLAIAQLVLAYDCSSTNIECLDHIAEAQHVGTLVFGTIHRVTTDVAEELEVELHYFHLLQHRVVSHYTGRLPLVFSQEAITNLAVAAAPELLDCLHLSPDPVPVAAAVIPPVEDTSAPSTDVSPESLLDVHPAPTSYNHEWAGWSLIGLGAALLLADIPVWVRLNEMNSDPSLIDYRHRLSFGTGGDACSNANDGNIIPVHGLGVTDAMQQVGHVRGICSEGATLEALQYVFLALGLASAGTGAMLLASGVLVSPSVSTDHATLTVSGSF
jgi:hypothetical protein